MSTQNTDPSPNLARGARGDRVTYPANASPDRGVAPVSAHRDQPDREMPERELTPRDAIEIALSAAFQDAGIGLSDTRWERLCRNATSEIQRQLRKVELMQDSDVDQMTTTVLQREILKELRQMRRLMDARESNTNGKQSPAVNGGHKKEFANAK